MSLSLILKLLHVFAAFGMVTGIIGRNITFGQAAKTTNIETAYALLRASEIFERRFVFPMSGAVLVLGLITAWSAGWPLLGFLQGATSNWLLLSLILTVGIAAGVAGTLAPRRRQRMKILDEAHTQGAITAALTAALNDPIVLRLRWLELGAVVIIVALMVLKPF